MISWPAVVLSTPNTFAYGLTTPNSTARFSFLISFIFAACAYEKFDTRFFSSCLLGQCAAAGLGVNQPTRSMGATR
jgi:hypothetical protein